MTTNNNHTYHTIVLVILLVRSNQQNTVIDLIGYMLGSNELSAGRVASPIMSDRWIGGGSDACVHVVSSLEVVSSHMVWM